MVQRLPIGCPPLDALLGGGVEGGAITLLYGEAGTGKTNVCLQLAAQAATPERKVAYVDTEGVSLERFNQIAGAEAHQRLRNILFYSPANLEEQVRMVRALDKIASPSLVVVDSLNMYYRLQLAAEGDDAAGRALTGMLGDLLRLSRAQDVPIVVTGQVYSAEESVRAFGGRIMEHIVKTIVRLERLAPGVRRATIVKHRSAAEGARAEFFITANGLAAAPAL